MKKEWSWVGRYVAVIFIALVLAAALGSMRLFNSTSVIANRLTAAHIVNFLGYGTALTVFWLLGQRVTVVLAEQGGRWSFMRHLLLPAVSLIVAASAHSVLFLVLGPLMDSALRNAYDWTFIAIIVGAAAWLVTALFNQSSSLTEAFTSATQPLESAKPPRSCSQCGALVEDGAKFCKQCGGKLEA